jgi:cytochrome b561
MPIEAMSGSAPPATAQRDEHYDAVTIWLHWSTVALVTILWTLGQVIDWLPSRPLRSGLWSTHVVLGLMLALGVLNWLAKGTHYAHALYLLLLTVVVLGLANASYRGYNLYGVLTLPRFGSGDPAAEDSIKSWHGLAANLTIALAFLHAAAALGHQYVLRDHLLQRMRPAQNR